MRPSYFFCPSVDFDFGLVRRGLVVVQLQPIENSYNFACVVCLLCMRDFFLILQFLVVVLVGVSIF